MIFNEKLLSRYILLTDQITLFHCLYFLQYWEFLHYDYLLSCLWRHKFWDEPKLSYQVVFLHNQKVKTKMQITQKQKQLLLWNKKYFSPISFIRIFSCQKLSQTQELPFNVLLQSKYFNVTNTLPNARF